jgi:hypothetical protein
MRFIVIIVLIIVRVFYYPIIDSMNLRFFSNYLLYMIILFICLLNYTKNLLIIFIWFNLRFYIILSFVAFKVRVCAFAWAQIGEKINNRLPTNWVFFSFLFFCYISLYRIYRIYFRINKWQTKFSIKILAFFLVFYLLLFCFLNKVICDL